MPVPVAPFVAAVQRKGQKAAITYLSRDLFTTARIAGAVNGAAAEPGPGTRAVDGNGNLASIAGGELVLAQQTTAWTTAVRPFGDTALTRAAGAFASAYLDGTGGNPMFGLAKTTPVDGDSDVAYALPWSAGDAALVLMDNGVALSGADVIGAGYYHQMIALRPTNGAYLISEDNNGVTMPWGSISNNGNLYPFFGSRSTTGSLVAAECFTGLFLPDAFLSQYGLATAYTASPAANATLAHDELYGHVEVTWTIGAGETLDIEFRRTDDNNCMLVRCVQASSTIQLWKREGGVEASAAAAGAYTWSVGGVRRILIRFRHQTIDVYVQNTAAGGPTRPFNAVINQSFNTLATEARTTLAVANFTSWPYYLPTAQANAVRQAWAG